MADKSELVKNLCKKYKGLRASDLSQMNPEYSCIICSNEKCKGFGIPNHSCINHEFISLEKFVVVYNF